MFTRWQQEDMVVVHITPLFVFVLDNGSIQRYSCLCTQGLPLVVIRESCGMLNQIQMVICVNLYTSSSLQYYSFIFFSVLKLGNLLRLQKWILYPTSFRCFSLLCKRHFSFLSRYSVQTSAILKHNYVFFSIELLWCQ